MEVTYPCYWQTQDANGEWRWIYFSKDAEPIARSYKTFQTSLQCLNSILLINNSAEDPIFKDLSNPGERSL
jgi:uncharacterized protein YegP (UPF0339 family)